MRKIFFGGLFLIGLIAVLSVFLRVNYYSKNTSKSMDNLDNSVAVMQGLQNKHTVNSKYHPNGNDSIKAIPIITKKKPLEKPLKDERPKLAIIIDDIGNVNQAIKIRSINYKITPSIFPPAKSNPNSDKLASMFDFYMIHLPLEASHYDSPQSDTLTVSDNINTIYRYIKELREIFPSVVYINNHTGSKFTSDCEAMDRLFYAFKKFGFKFIDSKTTSMSKASAIGKKYGMKVLARDVFLDNELNEDYIKTQLAKAVEIAKYKGYAIAIGHPNIQTINAIKDSDNILKSVNIVYVKDLDKHEQVKQYE